MPLFVIASAKEQPRYQSAGNKSSRPRLGQGGLARCDACTMRGYSEREPSPVSRIGACGESLRGLRFDYTPLSAQRVASNWFELRLERAEPPLFVIPSAREQPRYRSAAGDSEELKPEIAE